MYLVLLLFSELTPLAISFSFWYYLEMPDKKERTFGAGQVLFREGDKGGELYFLQMGEVELTVKDPSTGDPIRIAEVKPPAVLGTMTFLEGDDRSATATAKSTVRVLIIAKDQREELLGTIPEWFKVLVKDLSSNLRRIDQEYSMTKAENESLKNEIKYLKNQLKFI